jgi:holo-[acyl-carrier protein] synthase
MSPDLAVMESSIERLATEALGRLAQGPGLSLVEGPPVIRVGIDLATVADVAGSIGRFGTSYLQRLFTPHELATCCMVGPDRHTKAIWSVESLAARFAAKEAVVKVLRPDGARPEWTSIEIHRSEDGWCEVRLSGRAQEQADWAGITDISVSLTHEGSLAAAVVIAVCGNHVLERNNVFGASSPANRNGRRV